MSYTQWVAPDLSATDATGMCLRFTQRVFQNLNPYYYESATSAWEHSVHKSYERNLPTDVAVPVYFSHWGTYGEPARYDNWGHVVAWIPGRGYLSSPAGGYGQQWFSTIEEVERTFNCRFVGWALDVGGLTVAWPNAAANVAVTPVVPEEDIMKRNYTPTFNPNITCPAGKWTTLTVNAEQWVSIMNAGTKRRLGVAHVALRGTGEFEARFLYSTVNPAEKNKVITESGSVVARYDREGLHSWPFELDPKTATKEQRIRIQVRPVGKPVKITSVRPIVDYWEQ